MKITIHKSILWLVILSLSIFKGYTQTFDPDKCYQIVNKATNKVLEIRDSTKDEGAQIFQWASSNSKAHQLWVLDKLADGKFYIVSRHSSLFIDAPDCAEGGLIKQFNVDGTNSQKWTLLPQSDGTFKLFSSSCNKYLRVDGGNAADGANVGVKSEYPSDAFKWYIREAPCVANCITFPEPTFSFVQPSGVNTGSITITNLPDSASSSMDGTNFTVGKKTYSGLTPGYYYITVKLTSCEKMGGIILERTKPSVSTFDPNECYILINKVTNKVLEVKDDSKVEGAQVYQAALTSGKKSQLWQITKLSDGRLQFKSKSSGKLIDAPDCTNGAIIKQFAHDGTSSQTWRVEVSSDIYPDGSLKFVNQSCNKYLSASTAIDSAVTIQSNNGTEVSKWYIEAAPVCVTTTCPPTPIVSFVVPSTEASGNITIINLPVGASSSIEGPLIDNPVFSVNKKVYEISAVGEYKVKIRINGCESETTITVLACSRCSFRYDDACYRMVNKATGKVLTIKDDSQTNGAAIIISPYTGGSNQKWIIGQFFGGASYATKVYISKSSKNWLKASFSPLALCSELTGPLSVFQNKFAHYWYPIVQDDGSIKIGATPGCIRSVVRAVSATAQEVVVGIDDFNDLSKWILEVVPCATSTASATQETFGFEARASEGRAKLQWITNTGYKNDYFEIERLNANGNFDILGRQNTDGGEGLKSYTFTDNSPYDGDNFYRINSVFQNAPPQYSEVKKVTFSKNDGINIFPNPADEFINVDLRKYEGKTVALSVYNSVGLLVKKQTIEKVSAAPQQIDVQGFGTGSYLLRIQSEGKREVTRLFHIAK